MQKEHCMPLLLLLLACSEEPSPQRQVGLALQQSHSDAGADVRSENLLQQRRPEVALPRDYRHSNDEHGVLSSCEPDPVGESQVVAVLSSEASGVLEVSVLSVSESVVERSLTSSEGTHITRGWEVTFIPVRAFRGSSPDSSFRAFIEDASLGAGYIGVNGQRFYTRENEHATSATRAGLEVAIAQNSHQLVVLQQTEAGFFVPLIVPLSNGRVLVAGVSVDLLTLLRGADHLRSSRPVPRAFLSITEARRQVPLHGDMR